jgi:hypothetical protein
LRESKWKHLLAEYPDLGRFYNNLARRSENTAKERVRVLYRFLTKNNYTPTSLVETASKDKKQIENTLLDFTTQLSKEGKAPGYIENYIKAVRTWLSFNGIELKQRINIGNRNEQPTIENERVPTHEELKQLLNYADNRGKTSIALMSQSGLRPQVLGDATGSDGLKIGDLPELEINGSEVSFAKTPTMVVVRASLSKARHRYFTFLSEEGCGYLSDYLEKRLSAGEKLTKDSPIITFKTGYGGTGYQDDGVRRFSHITTKTLTKEIRDAMRPRFDWRPYVLRSYFDTQLMVAENHGKISHAYRQFFMGHSGDMEARYTTNKGRLPEDVIEDMRSSYRKCQDYLQVVRSGEDEDRLMGSFRRQLLLVSGFTVEEVDDMDLSMDDVVFQEVVRKRLLGSASLGGSSQRVVGVGEVEGYLSEGWGFVANLPNKRAVVRPPDFSSRRVDFKQLY